MKIQPSKILLFVAIIIITTTCSKEPNLPVADFSFQNSQEAPATVEFTNLSENADSYFWEFGNGTYSKEKNPTRKFHMPGRYKITLKATNEEGFVKKEATLHVLGTTYRIENRLPYKIYGVISFVDKGGAIYEMVNIGSLGANEISPYVRTEYLQITIAIQVSQTEYFIISPAYNLEQNSENELTINEFTEGYIVEWDPWGNNEEK